MSAEPADPGTIAPRMADMAAQQSAAYTARLGDLGGVPDGSVGELVEVLDAATVDAGPPARSLVERLAPLLAAARPAGLGAAVDAQAAQDSPAAPRHRAPDTLDRSATDALRAAMAALVSSDLPPAHGRTVVPHRPPTGGAWPQHDTYTPTTAELRLWRALLEGWQPGPDSAGCRCFEAALNIAREVRVQEFPAGTAHQAAALETALDMVVRHALRDFHDDIRVAAPVDLLGTIAPAATAVHIDIHRRGWSRTELGARSIVYDDAALAVASPGMLSPWALLLDVFHAAACERFACRYLVHGARTLRVIEDSDLWAGAQVVLSRVLAHLAGTLADLVYGGVEGDWQDDAQGVLSVLLTTGTVHGELHVLLDLQRYRPVNMYLGSCCVLLDEPAAQVGDLAPDAAAALLVAEDPDEVAEGVWPRE